MTSEHGPFESEREALATRAARDAIAAFDADPGAGKGQPRNLKIMTDAIEAARVELTGYEQGLFRWLAGWELSSAVVLAGIIDRAYRAGLEAATSGEEIGFVVITRSQIDPNWDIDTPGLHQERETAELERDDRRERTRAVGRGERHEVAAVVRLEEEG